LRKQLKQNAVHVIYEQFLTAIATVIWRGTSMSDGGGFVMGTFAGNCGRAIQHIVQKIGLLIYSLGVNTPPLGAVKTNKNNDRMWE
jgi:predicted ABC-type sugar transport system permease subunit